MFIFIQQYLNIKQSQSSNFMKTKQKVKSINKVNQTNNKFSLDKKQYNNRRCQTPTISNTKYPKKKSKSKDKTPNRYKTTNNSIKLDSFLNLNISLNPQIDQNQSPFKHKTRPLSNLNNVRHTKNIEHQLMHLNDSVLNCDLNFNSLKQNNQANKKPSNGKILLIIEQGKKYMKNKNFQKAIKLFEQFLNKNQPNAEIMYLIGICYYNKQLYSNSIISFTNLLEFNKTFRKNVYLFLAISYKKNNLYKEALLILTNAIAIYSNYYDAILLRSKIFIKQKKYEDAIQDLNTCIKLNSKKLEAYIYKADCLRAINKFGEAIKIYSQILSLKESEQILLKRAITLVENNSIDEGLNELNKIISKNVSNSEAYLFKGLAYAKKKNYNDAILSYEQAIKFNISKKATTKSLYQISKLKIQMGDFYGASYNMQRSPSLEVDHQVLQKLKIFTEGSTLIMKRKFKNGIEKMNHLSKRQHLTEQIKPLIYSFRSYAYFCQCKFLYAFNDLNTSIKNGYSLDSASRYNHLLLEGIILSQNNSFKEAKLKFEDADAFRPGLPDASAYICLNFIAQYNRTNQKQNQSLLKESLVYIERSIQLQQHSNFYYIRSCILYILQEHGQSFKSVQNAIQKSDDHVMKHFYLRALINLKLKKYKQALNDLNIITNLAKELKEKDQDLIDQDEPQRQKQIAQTYLNRAKCYLLYDEKRKAFQDLQTYISSKPLDSEIHTIAGKLLFSIGACEDAIKAYNYSPNIQKNKQCLLERAQCYLVLKQLNSCLKDMIKLEEMGDELIKYDQYCLYSLKEASKNSQESYVQSLKKLNSLQTLKCQEGHIFNKCDLLFYKGLYFFYLRKYEQSIDLWKRSKTIKALNNQLQYLGQDQKNEESFQNRIYTGEEIQYNIAIAELMIGKLQTCTQVLCQYQGFQLLLKGQINPSNQQQEIDLTPFPIVNRLCSIFPYISYSQKIKFKLSFCLPTINPPDIYFQTENKILQSLNMTSTQPKPDAPWIKRNNFGVIFTDEVVGLDVDIRTEESHLNQPIRIYSDFDESPNQKKTKQILPLNFQLETKLAKIIKNK